jgi:hypothetical protein
MFYGYPIPSGGFTRPSRATRTFDEDEIHEDEDEGNEDESPPHLFV